MCNINYQDTELVVIDIVNTIMPDQIPYIYQHCVSISSCRDSPF